MKKAFTLAEVLITIGIIGIVAAITIPELVNRTQDREFKVAWKKEYAAFSNFLNTLNANHELPATYSGDIPPLIQKYMNVAKYCTDGTCWHQSNKWTNFAGYKQTTPTLYSFILNDGALLIFGGTNSLPASSPDTPVPLFTNGGINLCSLYLIDVNGEKGPNQVARDIFGISMCGDRVYPMGYTLGNFYFGNSTSMCNKSSTGTDWTNGIGCSIKALKEESY